MEKIFSAMTTDRDFTEDEHLENGNYFHYCSICGESFFGHKRRVVCKRCSKKSEDVEDKQ